MPEPKDQAPNGQSEETKPESLGDYFDLGVKEIGKENLPSTKKETKEAKEDTTPPPEKTVAPCKECPEGKKREDLVPSDIDWEKVDYATADYPKPLKNKDKIIWVENLKEMTELAHQGADYTQKRQVDADDKKRWEGEFTTKADELNKLGTQFNAIYDKLKDKETLKPEDKKPLEPVTEAQVYEKYGLDEDLIEPYQKKLITDITGLENSVKTMGEKNQELTNAVQVVMLNEAFKRVAEVVKKAREEYPFEEITNEQGENLTAKQFIGLLSAKANLPENKAKNRSLPELAAETVKEIHLMQQKGLEGKAAQAQVNDSMTPEEFKGKFPELFKKLVGPERDKAVADYEAEQSGTPPSLEPKETEVDLSKKTRKEKITSLADAIKEGFKDPEIKAGLTLGG